MISPFNFICVEDIDGPVGARCFNTLFEYENRDNVSPFRAFHCPTWVFNEISSTVFD